MVSLGAALFPAAQGLCAGADNVLIAAAAPTQPQAKTAATSAKSAAATYTDETIDKLFEGKGVGKKKLSEVCKENNFDVNLAKKKLAQQNIQIKDDETLYDAAQKVSKTPMDLVRIIFRGEPIKK
jgi:hypothetical protein